MKALFSIQRLTYSLLLFLALSAGCGSELTGSRVRVHFRDGRSSVHRLLSVRDTSIIVSPDVYPSDSAAAIQLIDVLSIEHEGSSRGQGALLGMGIGCAAAIGSAAYFAKEDRPFVAALFIAYGPYLTGGGGAIGYLLGRDDKEYDPWNAQDRLALRSFSRFSDGEPPELQKIP